MPVLLVAAFHTIIAWAPCVASEPNFPAIVRVSVESTNITSIGYSPAQKTLEIEFRNGAVYRYSEVPNATFESLRSAPSKGRYFAQHIRNRFEYRCVKAPAHK